MVRAALSLDNQAVLIQDFALDTVVAGCQRRLPVYSLDSSRQKAAVDVQVALCLVATEGPAQPLAATKELKPRINTNEHQ